MVLVISVHLPRMPAVRRETTSTFSPFARPITNGTAQGVKVPTNASDLDSAETKANIGEITNSRPEVILKALSGYASLNDVSWFSRWQWPCDPMTLPALSDRDRIN